MSELAMNLTKNKAKPKSVGYAINRLATAASIIFAVVMFFVICSNLGRQSAGTIGVLLVIEAALILYVRAQFRSSKLIKLVDSMKVDGYYMPTKEDEQVVRAHKCYFGIDYSTGIIAVGTLYEIGANKQERLYFDTDMVESFERFGNQLELNLRNRAIPTLRLNVLDGDRAYRGIEMACKMRDTYGANRVNGIYETTKSQMVGAGWMLERDY